MQQPNLARFDRALEIMKSKTDDQVDMSSVMDEASCGACGCVIGWCTTDPETFPGLKWNYGLPYWDKPLELNGVRHSAREYAAVGASVFSISVEDADELFTEAFSNVWLDDRLFPEGPRRSDREVAIARLEYAIERYSAGESLR